MRGNLATLGEVLALRGLGEVARLVGDSTQAGEYLTQALTLARQLGDRRGEAEALWALGLVASDNADCNRASELWHEVLVIYEKFGIPCAETVRAACASSTIGPASRSSPSHLRDLVPRAVTLFCLRPATSHSFLARLHVTVDQLDVEGLSFLSAPILLGQLGPNTGDSSCFG